MIETRNITWNNSKGAKLVVTVKLESLTDTHNDDFLGAVEGRTTYGIEVSATSDGKKYPSLLTTTLDENKALPAGYKMLGQIAMPAAAVAQFEAAVAELSAHPAYVAYLATVAAASKVQADARRDARNLHNTMTLNGRSY